MYNSNQSVLHSAIAAKVESVVSCVCQERYEIIGDSATNEDHYGPTKARLSDSLLLHHFEICCVGPFQQLALGISTIFII